MIQYLYPKKKSDLLLAVDDELDVFRPFTTTGDDGLIDIKTSFFARRSKFSTKTFQTTPSAYSVDQLASHENVSKMPLLPLHQ